MVNVNNPPPIPNKFYVTSTGPDGYAYRVNSATFSSGVALTRNTIRLFQYMCTCLYDIALKALNTTILN